MRIYFLDLYAIRRRLAKVRIDSIIFDFDGVFTDNHVYLSQDGTEAVRCSRCDGIGVRMLKSVSDKICVLSTESNEVVSRRAQKLDIDVHQSIIDKASYLETVLVPKYGLDLEKVLYIGNDINDIGCMRLCGFSVCPSDSNPLVFKEVDHVLSSRGGDGIALEIALKLFRIQSHV